jgi:hypothetical protein
MIRIYDRTMPGSNQRRYYEDSGYFNFGYWAAGAKSQREASDALVDQLMHADRILFVEHGAVCRRRAVIACIAFAPVALPLVLLAPDGIPLHSPWNAPGFFFVPLAALSAPRLLVTYRAVAVMVGVVATLAIAVLVLSPVLMIGNFIIAKAENVEPVISLARFATKTWHDSTGGRLEFVSGSEHAAWSVTFYSPDHPKVFPGYSEFLPQAEIQRRWKERGVLGICNAGESACTQMFDAALPQAKRVAVTLPVTFLGFSHPAESYVLYLQPAAGRAAF